MIQKPTLTDAFDLWLDSYFSADELITMPDAVRQGLEATFFMGAFSVMLMIEGDTTFPELRRMLAEHKRRIGVYDAHARKPT